MTQLGVAAFDTTDIHSSIVYQSIVLMFFSFFNEIEHCAAVTLETDISFDELDPALARMSWDSQ